MESGSMVDSVSFNPSGDANNASPWPSSILLAQEAYVVISRNDTTASAKSRADHTVEVTFWVADPPAVSFYTFHCSKPPVSDCEDADLEVQPHVVGAQGPFILLRTRFASGDDEDEYFIYKGDPESPSLESIPLPDDDRLRGVSEFGIVPRGDGGHYLLVALCYTAKYLDYRLHIFSSEDRTWRTKELLNPCPGVHTIIPAKVFMLQDGMLCWVDFAQGLLMCDVLQEPLHAHYIPLPEFLPENRPKGKQYVSGASARRFRDVACVDGMIKFIEMEHRVITEEIIDVPTEKPFNPRDKDVLYDSDLIMLSKRKDVDIKPKILRSVNGWSAMTWTREVGSNCWLKGCAVDVDDILVDHSVRLASYSPWSLKFKNNLAYPTLSTDANDLVYLQSSMILRNPNRLARVVAVDLAEKTLKVKALVGYPFGRRYDPSEQIFHPCALSNYLKRTKGIKLSESEITLGSSSNEPNNTAVCVGEPDSYESENKRPRLSAEKVNHAHNGAQSLVQNVLSSEVHPDQNNMLPQHFNRWEGPGYCGNCGYWGYPSWPHRSNSVPPQCFNKWGEPFNPVYAPSAPGLNMHSYSNYQSLWQQPSLSEQQTAPSRAFGAYEAPRPCFKGWSGASYHGNSQCFNMYAPSAPGLNMHSYSTYQLLWQQPSLSEQQTAPSRAFGSYEAPRPCFTDWSGASYHGNLQQFPAGISYSYGACSDNATTISSDSSFPLLS
nr:uncharacterized protein LOC117836107 isoform X3 [Setaria viridis]